MNIASGDYTWSLGTLIGLPIAGFLAVICLAVAVAAFLWRRSMDLSDYDRTFATGSIVGGIVSLVLVVIATGWFMWPWKAEYHQWRDTSGTVVAVDSRLLSDGHGTTQRFVVTLDGDRQRACDDTRCAQVKPGDDLTLKCKRAWQWAATPGWDCNFVNVRRGHR
jgi:nitrogen fixation-related uncharacterized protein